MHISLDGPLSSSTEPMQSSCNTATQITDYQRSKNFLIFAKFSQHWTRHTT